MHCPAATSLLLGSVALAGIAALGGCNVAQGRAHPHLDTLPPRVTLAVPPTAIAGMTVRLTADADDDRAIEQVAFYAIDGRGEVRLGVAERRPYEVEMRLPLKAPARLRVVARAIDDEGNLTQSKPVELSVVR